MDATALEDAPTVAEVNGPEAPGGVESAPTSSGHGATPSLGRRVIAVIPFAITHVLAFAGALSVQVTLPLLALCLSTYLVRMFFITAAYHRYFAHRSYKTSRAFQFLLALGGTTAAQKGVLWWAGHHRDHHRYSDGPLDPHSPLQRGFFWAHVGWIVSARFNETPFHRIKDFARFPELRWLNQHWLTPPLVGAAALHALGGLPVLVWGGLMSTVFLWHGTFTINSLSHLFGWRRFPTTDDSRNNPLLAAITLGEGWHNNHHHYSASANQGFYWYEVDVSFLVLRALEKLGLVWDLRLPPESVLAQGRGERVVLLPTVEATSV